MALYKAAFLPSTPSSLSPPSCSLCCRISRPALSLPLPPASLRSSLSLHASMFVHPPSLSLRLLPRTFRKSLSMNTRKMPFCSSSASNIPSSSSSSSLSSPNLSPPPKQRALFVTAVSAAGALFLGSLLSASAAMAAQPVVLQQLSAGMADVLPTLSKLALVLRTQGPLLVALLALSAFFSLAETSITTLWPWKVRELAEKEVDGGLFQLLRQDVTRFLTTILIGTTVVNIGATALVTEAATTIFGEAGVTAATGFMTVLLLLFTEIAPKSIAVHNATSVARVVVRPVAWLSIILYPLGRFCTAISMWLLKLLGLKSSGEPFVSEEELKLMLRGAEMSGAIEEEEQDMIENVLEIKDTYVREVMTPLVNVVAIDAAASLMDFKDLWVKHQYSRVPVYERRVDNIVGIGYAMDMLDYVDQEETLQRLNIGKIAHRPAYFVPDSMSVWNLLREFRIRKVHMAIVLNEYGGTVGLVTLEDVVEEIVGEIFDESDSKEEIRKKTGYVVQRSEGVFDVDANTSIEDLAEALDIAIPEGPYRYETVSGFVCEAFGYIPRTGDSKEMRLKRADEDEEDRRDSDEQEPYPRRNLLRFNLTILAGNARKVGAVRFQRIDGVDESMDGLRNGPEERERERDWEAGREREEREREKEKERARVRAEAWEREREEAERRRKERMLSGKDQEVESDEERGREQDAEGAEIDYGGWSMQGSEDDDDRPDSRKRLLVAESLDVDSMQDYDSELVIVKVENDHKTPMSGESVVSESEPRNELEAEGTGEAGAMATVGTANDRWEEQDKQVERRRQRRMRERAEALFESTQQRKLRDSDSSDESRRAAQDSSHRAARTDLWGSNMKEPP